MHQAINDVTWRGDDAIKLIFLVADAPPHLDYADDFCYAVDMAVASQEGIKIYPIASSGLDTVGEYTFRQMAQFTQGRFIFLTDDAGEPVLPDGVVPDLQPESQQSLGDYTVERLPDIVLRSITDEIAALQQP